MLALTAWPGERPIHISSSAHDIELVRQLGARVPRVVEVRLGGGRLEVVSVQPRPAKAA